MQTIIGCIRNLKHLILQQKSDFPSNGKSSPFFYSLATKQVSHDSTPCLQVRLKGENSMKIQTALSLELWFFIIYDMLFLACRSRQASIVLERYFRFEVSLLSFYACERDGPI